MTRGQRFVKGFSAARRGGSGGSTGHQPPTHFLCIPLVNEVSRPQLESTLGKFEDAISRVNSVNPFVKRIPAKAIRPVDTIHFTLGVMSLQQESKLEEAISCLKELNLKEILNSIESTDTDINEGLNISIESLASMHLPTETTVLYAEPRDPSNKLQQFGERILTIFKEKGFVTETRPLKFHATVLNTVYAGKDGRGNRIKIDAIKLLQDCSDFVWATNVDLNTIAICKMGAKREVDDQGQVTEKYEEVVSVEI